MSNSDLDDLDPDDLPRRPIRHKSLEPELLRQIQGIYRIVGRFLDTTLEQFEIEFMRDVYPETEIAAWHQILAAWIVYHAKFLDDEMQADEEERELLGALIAISTGNYDFENLGVPDIVGRRLVECYKETQK